MLLAGLARPAPLGLCLSLLVVVVGELGNINSPSLEGLEAQVGPIKLVHRLVALLQPPTQSLA
jgi:hypothetical protein